VKEAEKPKRGQLKKKRIPHSIMQTEFIHVEKSLQKNFASRAAAALCKSQFL